MSYSIATAHSAGPGYELSVVRCMLYLGGVFGDVLVIRCYLERTWGLLGCIWEQSGAILGHVGAILGPSWGYLGKTWGLLGFTLGVDHQALKTHTFLNAPLEHAIAVFAYKTPMEF